MISVDEAGYGRAVSVDISVAKQSAVFFAWSTESFLEPLSIFKIADQQFSSSDGGTN